MKLLLIGATVLSFFIPHPNSAYAAKGQKTRAVVSVPDTDDEKLGSKTDPTVSVFENIDQFILTNKEEFFEIDALVDRTKISEFASAVFSKYQYPIGVSLAKRPIVKQGNLLESIQIVVRVRNGLVAPT